MEVGADAASDTEDVEERDLFEVEEGSNLEIELVKEGMPTIQDLLFVIKSADLSEALPQVVKLLELAVTIPLTSVHFGFHFKIEDAPNQKGKSSFSSSGKSIAEVACR